VIQKKKLDIGKERIIGLPKPTYQPQSHTLNLRRLSILHKDIQCLETICKMASMPKMWYGLLNKPSSSYINQLLVIAIDQDLLQSQNQQTSQKQGGKYVSKRFCNLPHFSATLAITT
jgi:hypothetical protein